MNGLTNPPGIYLYRAFVDFCKSINGLAALVESDIDLPLNTGTLFLLYQQTTRQNQNTLLG